MAIIFAPNSVMAYRYGNYSQESQDQLSAFVDSYKLLYPANTDPQLEILDEGLNFRFTNQHGIETASTGSWVFLDLYNILRVATDVEFAKYGVVHPGSVETVQYKANEIQAVRFANGNYFEIISFLVRGMADGANYASFSPYDLGTESFVIVSNGKDYVLNNLAGDWVILDLDNNFVVLTNDQFNTFMQII